jgi:endonuclease YncB( thermonuclease family)
VTRRDGLSALLVLLALAGVAALLQKQRPHGIVAGPAWAVDGDSLRVDGQEIRLAGLDAPELHQTCRRDGRSYPCGEVARAELRRMILNAVVTCDILGRDRYRRRLGRCSVHGEDIGASLVSRGLAVAYGRYAKEEERARRAGAGLWAGTFDQPSEWRKSHPPAHRQPQAVDQSGFPLTHGAERGRFPRSGADP